MANEASVQGSMVIRKSGEDDTNLTLLDYRDTFSFRATVTGTKGPCPGALTIPTGGKIIPLGELVTPGLCMLKNLSEDYAVDWGSYDPETDRAFLVGRLKPGERFPHRFSPSVQQEYVGTGTGTLSEGSSYFFMKAIGGEAVVSVEAFED